MGKHLGERKLIMDIGIRLGDKTNDLKNFDKLINDINEVVAKYGFKVSQYANWDIFRKSCVLEQKYVKKIITEINKKENLT